MKGAWAFEVRGPNELREVLGSVAMVREIIPKCALIQVSEIL
jgi:hypothetical protein